MTVLELRGLGVAFQASQPILQDVSLRLGPGFYGLVGANGAGKTTLLRVLAGELEPHEGKLSLSPREAVVAYCEQRVEELAADVRELAATSSGVGAELRGRLGLVPSALARWATLSPGERQRWKIGAALAREPDVLLLDEPTNHLDAEARDRLLGALARFRGTGVVVSHDRELLEQLPRAILRVHGGTLREYAGNWSKAKASWEAERSALEQARGEAKARVRAVERQLHAARREQASAEHALGSRSRMKGVRDHDARSMGRKVVAGWGEARAGRQVRLLNGELERAVNDVPALERDRTLGGEVFARFERSPHPLVFHLATDELRAGARVVLTHVRVNVGREERVRVTGANGAGKTTLLSALVAAHAHPERLLFLPQELEPCATARLVAELHDLTDEVRGRVLSVFSALGSDPERLLGRRREAAATLSPGEARKLALALGLGRHAWALVLDEPTNHLDLPTIERLERALAGYPGALLLVTHDDAFARAVTTRTMTVRAGTVT